MLRTKYGLASASQPNVSRWLHRTRPNKGARAALLRYCEDFAPAPGEDNSRMDRDDVATFEDLQRQVAGESLFGPRQAALVRSEGLANAAQACPSDRSHRSL